jgi:hypothetical protein
MHKYELSRMAQHGYLHVDAHPGNVLINPNYPYFTNDKNNQWYGKALIIDFGRITDITGKNIGREIVAKYTQNTFGGLIPGGQIITPYYRNMLNTLRTTMASSFLSSLNDEKKRYLLELIANNQIILNLKKKIIKKSAKMIEDIKKIEEEKVLGKRTAKEEAQQLEAQQLEAQRLEAERIEAQRIEAEDKSIEESDKINYYTARIGDDSDKINYYTARRGNESDKINSYTVRREEKSIQNLGEAAYIKATGNIPSASPINNNFNLWNWARILVVNAVEQGAVGKIIELALNKGGNGNKNCPNLSIDINKIPKCFKNKKDFRDMALILHPDQNNNCSEEDKKIASEKFKILNSNKDEQNTNYGEINETTYKTCMSSDDSNINIKQESEELEILSKKQDEMDSLYLKSMKGKEISKTVIEKLIFIFNLCNEKGKNNINEINNIFEKILEELYEILYLKNKIYNSSSDSISDDNTNISNSMITVEKLKKNITQKIKEYREQISFLLRENAINTVSEDESLLITCIIDVTFRNYVITIETLNNSINSIDGLINIKNGNKMNLLNIWFGIPQNFRITQNGGNELTTINNNTVNTSFYNKVPVYGLKYELATTPLISLIKKYKIGTMNITNLNINSVQFNNNIKDMIKQPLLLENIPVTGGKIKKYNKTIKNKTKKIRKNQKTKRRY